MAYGVIHPSILGAIGNTPLIRLKRASEETGCEILGKAEFLNPGGSVKDRAAIAIVRDAERRGLLRPGGSIGPHRRGLAHALQSVVLAARSAGVAAFDGVFNGLGNMVTLLATGRWVADSQCGYKAFGPRAVKQLNLRMSGFEFCTEIVRESVHHKWQIAQVPVKVVYSEYTLAKGQSFANGVRTAFKILLRSFLR